MANNIASTFSQINGASTRQYSFDATGETVTIPVYKNAQNNIIPVKTLLFFNEGPNTVYLTHTATPALPSATDGGMPLAAGAYLIFNVEGTQFSGICGGSGTAVLDVSYGQGE